MPLLRNIAIYINDKIMNNEALAFFIMKALPTFRLLFGKEYRKIVRTKSFSSNIRSQELFSIAEHSVNTTPYYKFKTEYVSIDKLEVFERIFTPFGKEVLLNNFNELLSSHYHKNNYESMTTGGTSGAPTRFFVPKTRFGKEYGFYHKIWRELGYNEDLRAVLRNKKLPTNKTYKINPITKELIFDGFRNNESYFEEIYKKLIKFNIGFIQGYPSSIYNFFQYLYKKKYDMSFVKGVFLSSEIFLEHQRKLLTHILKLPVISVYGHSEKLIMAVDFKGNGQYQVIEDYGYLELIDEKGNTIKKEGQLGEIVGTTFSNFGMPLIRYCTGDYSSYVQYSENKPRILNGIQGRWQEMKIYNKDGSFVSPTALNLHDDLYECIDGLQYFQKEMGELDIRIIPNEYFDEIKKEQLLNHFKERMLPHTSINLVLVDQLKKKANGKFLLLETQIKQIT